MSKQATLEKITSLAKRRGILFPNSEIYGGIAGFFDYGPVGVEMKNNLKKLWWDNIVTSRENIVGIDGTIITHPKVWKASGHVKHFTDELVECKKCQKRFRTEELDSDNIGKCPACGGEMTKPRKYNILFHTEIGVLEGEKTKAYLRGEACQTIYLNYKNVLNSTRLQIPFGIAQIGKAFRNELTPGKLVFRSREFEQWDLQFFVHKDDMKKWYEYWKNERMKIFKDLYTDDQNLRFRKHGRNELAFYAKVAYDIEYKTPWGWEENEGIHWRADYDLTQHSKFSSKKLTYTDPKTQENYVPWIVETSGGVDRTLLFLLFDSYDEEKLPKGKTRIVLRLNPKIAAYKAAIFPLVANKPKLTKKAREVFDLLSGKFSITWDARGNIGKRYRYQDEIGTPFCLTIDYETLENNTITIRDRDTMKQDRIKVDEASSIIKERINR
ncbi:MAG: glycine--tRNA ligase [Patescibacteria group bacterium]|nr:glycine--tRNA ligase [Patescibacteria group bacterium]